jgi:soluble lytic murein transglycosylase-like protein
MSSKRIGFGVVVLCSWLAVPVIAEAQIYAWRDAAGTLVLSTEPKDPSAQVYLVSKSAAVLATRPAATTRRAEAYEDLIIHHSAEQNISADLVRAVIQVESAFNPFARSVKGAMGLMQLMPGTARDLGVTNAYDPAQNIRGGVTYLKQLLTRFESNVELALAAYNAGPGAVEKYGAVPPYHETRNYVHKIRGKTGGAPAVPPSRLYRIVETVDGKEVTRYSNTPAAGAALVTPYGR